MSGVRPKRRLSLQTKAVALLLVIAVLPLAVTALLVGQVAAVAQNVAHGEAERLHAPLERASEAYREAVSARKDEFRRAARAAALDPRLEKACAAADAAEAGVALRALVFEDDALVEAALLREAGGEGTLVVREVARAGLRGHVRALTVTAPLPEAPTCTVRLTYVANAKLLDDYAIVMAALQEHRQIEKIRQTLPPAYRVAFVALVGVVAIGATAIAIWLARGTVRRIGRLVAATRRVGEGDLDARVPHRGDDELADLADAFNQMVDDLRRSRAEIEYLEKIGAWQEVARRLAHEIKNPLTPIQLVVQQLHSKYRGDDPQFKKLLDDAHEIVGEEIAGLRRLVDAFRGFAKLPKVEPAPIDLAVVVEDVAREVPFDAEGPGVPLMISGDRHLLKRALANLIENAGQAGAKRVRVTWARRGDAGDRVELIVDDDGPGVPAEIRARVFDPYVTTKEHGTGLGLAIVKKTLLEHGGDVALAQEPSPLGGARFTVTLPAAGEPSARVV